MAVDKNDIITLLKQKGPLVPTEIKSKVGGDTIIVGAILSEQTSKGVIKISHMKRGASPFYYLPGQEAQLEKHKELLDPKDQQTLDMLRERKVLQDASLELFHRVSLRRLKDFAKELNVNTIYGELLFWRYHLTREQEALDILEKRYGNREEKTTKATAPENDTVKEHQSQQTQQEDNSQQARTDNAKSRHSDTEESDQESVTTSQSTTAQAKPISHRDTRRPSHSNNADTQQELSGQEFEQTAFYQKAMNYFSNKNIKVLSQAQAAKNREYDFTILVGTDVGELKMFARAKSKKKLNEGDVAPALLKAKTKELPCLFLTDGEFTKKGLKLMEHEYKGLMIDQL
ncbi:MAG: hypothetical protein ACQESE_03395 [Nanobdellota archaeon]